MELFKQEPNVDFIKNPKKIKIFTRIILLCVLSALIFINGLNLSMEYTGGTTIELSFFNKIDIFKLNKLLNTQEKKTIKIIQHINKRIIIKIPKNIEVKKILYKINNLYSTNNTITLHKIDYISTETSNNIILNSIYVTFATLFIVIFYIHIRFSYLLALGSLLTLLQNMIIVIGFFSIFNLEFNLAALSATLIILGYTLNNIVVIYDQIRKNEVVHKDLNKLNIVNKSLNQTLARTILTSALTLITMLMLLIFDVETLHTFATALVIGIIAGSYSSISTSCYFYTLKI